MNLNYSSMKVYFVSKDFFLLETKLRSFYDSRKIQIVDIMWDSNTHKVTILNKNFINFYIKAL